jgi:uncharacterized membrane protein
MQSGRRNRKEIIMFGFVLGTACLIGLVCAVAGRRHYRACGSGYGYRGRFSPWHAIFERLDTTPGQEKTIRMAVEDFLEKAHELRRETRRSRRDFAQAFGGTVLDEAGLEGAYGQFSERLEQLKQHAMHAIGTIHEALDDRQRRRLAELIDDGFGWGFRRGSPYRV